MADPGQDLMGNIPKQFAAFIKAEVAKKRVAVKMSGASID